MQLFLTIKFNFDDNFKACSTEKTPSEPVEPTDVSCLPAQDGEIHNLDNDNENFYA